MEEMEWRYAERPSIRDSNRADRQHPGGQQDRTESSQGRQKAYSSLESSLDNFLTHTHTHIHNKPKQRMHKCYSCNMSHIGYKEPNVHT